MGKKIKLKIKKKKVINDEIKESENNDKKINNEEDNINSYSIEENKLLDEKKEENSQESMIKLTNTYINEVINEDKNKSNNGITIENFYLLKKRKREEEEVKTNFKNKKNKKLKIKTEKNIFEKTKIKYEPVIIDINFNIPNFPHLFH